MSAESPLKRQSRTPDAYLIMAALAVIAFIATYLVTPGAYQVSENASGRAQIVPGTYAPASAPEGAPLLWSEDRPGLASFLFEGLITGDRNSATIGLMAFIFIVGGAFGVILRAGSIERALRVLMSRQAKANDALAAWLFVAFSLCGAVFGMGEEAIVFALIVVPALIRAGYDSITGLLCTYVATQVGFATSWMNPFSVVIAQGISDLPALSGLWFRVAMWSVFTLIGAVYVWRYARGVRLKPQTSQAFASDVFFRDEAADNTAGERLGVADWLIMAIVAGGVAWVAWGVTTQGYYLLEIAGQFFVMGVLCAIVARLFRLNDVDGNALVMAFRDGATQMTPAILIVAAAKGIVVLLGGGDPTTPSVLNAALNGAAMATSALPGWAAAWGMYVFQSAINVVIVSGSGQAALTMPLMAPLADLTGVTRQTAVLAFQLGDGITNVITPASAALMGCLGAARLDWVTWMKFFWRPLLGLMALCSAAVLLAHGIGYA